MSNPLQNVLASMPPDLLKALRDLVLLDAKLAAEERAYQASPQYRAQVDAQRAAAAAARRERLAGLRAKLEEATAEIAQIKGEIAAVKAHPVTCAADRADRDEAVSDLNETLVAYLTEARAITNQIAALSK